MSIRTKGGAVRARVGIATLLGVASLLLAAPAVGGSPPGASGAPILDPVTRDYARVRITATANSSWAVATFTGLEIIDHVVVSGQSGVTVTPTSFSWLMGTGTSPPLVLDVLISSPVDAALSLTTTKGDAGSFTVDFQPISTTAVVSDAVNHVNSQTGSAGLNSLTTPIPRELLMSDGVDIGPIDDERLVMAMVHPWWKGPEWGAIAPDRPFGPWTSADPWQVDAAIDQMVFAGIDVALYSYGWPGYQDDPLVDNLQNAARTDGRVRVAPVIAMEAARDKNGGRDMVDYLVDVIGSALVDASANPGLFLEREGRPVVFFYADWILDSSQWNALIARVTASGHALFPITHVVDGNRESEGYWEYIGPSGQDESRYTAHSRARTMRGRLQSLLRPELEPRVIVGSVWPGYDDSSQQRVQHRFESRGTNGAFYNGRWRAALEGLPDWVVATSWNEWWEQTHIAPSSQGMTLALWQTLGWSREFHQR